MQLRTLVGASGDGSGVPAQKFVRNAANVGTLRRGGGLAKHHAVVIAGNREDGAIVFTVRFVKLIVVILAFAKVVDDVSEVEKKRGTVDAAGLHVRRHSVSDGGLLRKRPGCGLTSSRLCRPRIAHGVKRNFPSGIDGIVKFCGMKSVSLR
jgi:hypothetical protein